MHLHSGSRMGLHTWIWVCWDPEHEPYKLDRGVLGVLNDNPGNAFAFWVTDGVTDLGPGVLGP